MSRDCFLLAERREQGAWRTLGESRVYRGDLQIPATVIDISAYDEILAVLIGLTSDVGPPFHSDLEEVESLPELPSDLSRIMARYLESRSEPWVRGQVTCLPVENILAFDWQAPSILFSAFASNSRAHLFDPRTPEQSFPFEAWSRGRVASSADLPLCANPTKLPSILNDDWPEEEVLHYLRQEETVEVSWAESHFRFLGQPDSFFEALRELGPPDEVRLFIWVE